MSKLGRASMQHALVKYVLPLYKKLEPSYELDQLVLKTLHDEKKNLPALLKPKMQL